MKRRRDINTCICPSERVRGFVQASSELYNLYCNTDSVRNNRDCLSCTPIYNIVLLIVISHCVKFISKGHFQIIWRLKVLSA
jgi:hypothetical protein